MDKRERIASTIREQIERAQGRNDVIQENNLRNLLANVHSFSEGECKTFLLGMEFRAQLPTTTSVFTAFY